MTKKITIGVIYATLAVIITWDLVVAWNPIDGDTVSEITLGFGWRHPTAPYVLGIILGHLTWPMRFKKPLIWPMSF